MATGVRLAAREGGFYPPQADGPYQGIVTGSAATRQCVILRSAEESQPKQATRTRIGRKRLYPEKEQATACLALSAKVNQNVQLNMR